MQGKESPIARHQNLVQVIDVNAIYDPLSLHSFETFVYLSKNWQQLSLDSDTTAAGNYPSHHCKTTPDLFRFSRKGNKE